MQIRFLTVGGWAAYASRIPLLVGVVLVGLLPASAWAQDQQQTTPPWLEVTVVHVKAGHQAEFEDMVKKLTMAGAKAKSPPVEVAQVVEGDQGVYHIVAYHQKLAEKDNPPPPPMKPEEMAGVIGRLVSTLGQGRTFLAASLPQFSTEGDGDAQPKLLFLRKVHVAANRGDDFVKWIETDLMPAIKKAKMGLTVSRGVFGDSPQNFYFASPVANWAAFDQPDPLRAAMSAKAYQQMIDKLKGITEGQEITVLRLRSDLSSPAE